MTAAHVIPPAPAALLHKLRTVTAQGLLNAEASQPVPSPCVSVCRMDTPQHYCVGCLRTLDELRAWGSASADAKRAIWADIQQRSTSAGCAEATPAQPDC